MEPNEGRGREAILEHSRRLAESAVSAGPVAAVPTAPGWTTTDLVAHVGQTQHWVAAIIEQRITDPTQLPTDFAEPPTASTQPPRRDGLWTSTPTSRACSSATTSRCSPPHLGAAAAGIGSRHPWYRADPAVGGDRRR
jgi:hypothetical protein